MNKLVGVFTNRESRYSSARAHMLAHTLALIFLKRMKTILALINAVSAATRVHESNYMLPSLISSQASISLHLLLPVWLLLLSLSPAACR
eukprot:6171995-Pleurochrysis_carterae.AAC.2